MKRVKILQSIAGLAEAAHGLPQDWSFRIGEEVEIPGELAAKWAASGVCELVADTPPFQLADGPRQKRGRKGGEGGDGSAE